MYYIALPKYNLLLINGLTAFRESLNRFTDEIKKLDLDIKCVDQQKYFKIYTNFFKKELCVLLQGREDICNNSPYNYYKNIFLLCTDCLSKELPPTLNIKKFTNNLKKVITKLNNTEYDSVFHITSVDCFDKVTSYMTVYDNHIPGDIADQIGIISSVYL